MALLGLAFKPDTDDMREASSLVLASRLKGEGATVRGYDPVAEQAARDLLPDVEFCASAEDALDGADAAVLVTEWPEFAELDWRALRERMATPVLIDGRNFLDPAALRDAGFTYEGIVAGANARAGGERGALMQALILVGGEGPASAADPDRAEAGSPARRPSVDPLHDRLAVSARGGRHRDGVRVPRRGRSRRPRRGG